jgi:hypothetical protein
MIKQKTILNFVKSAQNENVVEQHSELPLTPQYIVLDLFNK